MPNPTLHQSLSIKSLLESVFTRNASDLHLCVGVPPTLRIDGELTPIPNQPVLTPEDTEQLAFSILNEEQKEAFIKDKEVDLSYALENKARFRINAFHQKGYISVALRYLPFKIRTLEELGLPAVCQDFTKLSQGLVLITGPTGHGKSTTLAAMVDQVNHERADHIITIEDPIEYVFTHAKSIIDQREIHLDTHSFARALRASLREDPDVVLVGEMRDLETIAAAITIAETGHLVFATLHTNSASQTVDRIIDVFPPNQQPTVRTQMANILAGIVSQRLLPQIGGGRVVAAEILFSNPAIRNLIREGKSYQIQNVIQTSKEDKMISLDKVLAALVQKGVLTEEAAEPYTIDIRFFHKLLATSKVIE
jgi:twitching motility protein PilT